MAGVDATLHKLEKSNCERQTEEQNRLSCHQSAIDMSSECMVITLTRSDSETEGKDRLKAV